MTSQGSGLPKELADHFTRPFARFLKIEAIGGALLLATTMAAILMMNSPASDAFSSVWETDIGIRIGPLDFARTFRQWINDGLMTLLFFVVSLEIKRELTLGELRSWRHATLPLAGAMGGMIFPIVIYLMLTAGGAASVGWGSVMASDTAFLVVCLTVLRRYIPQSLRVFLISLAIFDDIGAILVVSVAYSTSPAWLPVGGTLIGFATIAVLLWFGIRSTPVYALVAFATWVSCDASGFHPTIVGVVLGLMTPARHWVDDERLRSIFARVLAHPRGGKWSGDTIERRDLRRAGVAAGEALSPLERYELFLHPWAAFVIMPLFAFANAGVALGQVDLTGRLPFAIGVALLVGKPVGVLALTLLAERLRIGKRSRTLTWPHLCAGSVLTGMGFTMAIFMAQVAQAGADLNAVKVAILAASVLSAVLGCALLVALGLRAKKQAAA